MPITYNQKHIMRAVLGNKTYMKFIKNNPDPAWYSRVPHKILITSFSWKDTEEGFDYWNAIYYKMKHVDADEMLAFERHCALVMYAWWSRLESNGLSKWEEKVRCGVYDKMFYKEFDHNTCPACVVASRRNDFSDISEGCKMCPLPPFSCRGNDSIFDKWCSYPSGADEKKILAGDMAHIAKEWCRELRIIA